MKISNEAKIGILVVVVFMILSYLTWEAGDFDFTPEGYNLKVLNRGLYPCDLI